MATQHGTGRSARTGRGSAARPQPVAGAASAWSTDWVWPRWLERQLDPSNSAWLPLLPGDRPHNVTGRSWTALGCVGHPGRVAVDASGLVTPGAGGWAVDWWVQDGDRWYFPSRQVAVRQRLVDDAPVVETALRVAHGDVVQRVWAVQHPNAGTVVVIELEAQTEVPVAAALCVRPASQRGLVPIQRIDLDGLLLVVDGAPALVLPRPPEHTVLAGAADGDAASLVAAHRPGRGPASVVCPAGMAQATLVWPLTPGSPWRAGLLVDALGAGAVELSEAGAGTRRVELGDAATRERLAVRGPRVARRILPSSQAPARPPAPWSADGVAALGPLSDSAGVARSWASLGRSGVSVDLPDGALNRGLQAGLHHLRGADRGGRLGGDHELSAPDTALVVSALVRAGHAGLAREVVGNWLAQQRLDGSVAVSSGPANPPEPLLDTAAILWASGQVAASAGGDAHWCSTLAQPVARAAGWIARRQESLPSVAAGLCWTVAGLAGGAALLERAGEREAGRRAAEWSRHAAERLAAACVVAPPGRARSAGEVAAPAPSSPAPSSLVGSAEAGSDDTQPIVIDPPTPGGTPGPLGLGAGALLAPGVPTELRVTTMDPRRQGLSPAGAAALLSCHLGALSVTAPAVPAAVSAATACSLDDAVMAHEPVSGLSPRLTALLAGAERDLGQPARCGARLRRLASLASPTWVWPDVIHPHTLEGCGIEGHDVVMTALWVDLLLRILVDDRGSRLAFLTVLPAEWEGQPLEVHQAPTRYGPVSFALRWHGSQPVLLWQAPGAPADLYVCAPGLDRHWSGRGAEGEVLVRS
jgi:hypothetical protein